MRTKKCDWGNIETGEVLYGIQVFVPVNPRLSTRLGEWQHAAQNGKPLLFKEAAKRDAAQAEIRRSKLADWHQIPSPLVAEAQP